VRRGAAGLAGVALTFDTRGDRAPARAARRRSSSGSRRTGSRPRSSWRPEPPRPTTRRRRQSFGDWAEGRPSRSGSCRAPPRRRARGAAPCRRRGARRGRRAVNRPPAPLRRTGARRRCPRGRMPGRLDVGGRRGRRPGRRVAPGVRRARSPPTSPPAWSRGPGAARSSGSRWAGRARSKRCRDQSTIWRRPASRSCPWRTYSGSRSPTPGAGWLGAGTIHARTAGCRRLGRDRHSPPSAAEAPASTMRGGTLRPSSRGAPKMRAASLPPGSVPRRGSRPGRDCRGRSPSSWVAMSIVMPPRRAPGSR